MSKVQEQQDQIKEFLAQGGKVEQIPRGRSGYAEGQTRSAWGAPRKKTVVVDEVKAKPKTPKP